jgi:hypothetical protein
LEEGKVVGKILGYNVGTVEGDCECLIDGAEVFVTVGAVVGLIDGIDDGCKLGSAVNGT